jgi:hypothetical protein
MLYAYYVNLLGDNILVDTTKKSTEILLGASKEADIKVKAERTKHMPCHQNAGQNRDIKTANRSF